MRILLDGLDLSGNCTDILSRLREDAGLQHMELGPYLDFMYDNLYKMLGKKPRRTGDIESDAKTLFYALRDAGVLYIKEGE